jgi:glycosyltransferase involved in cell wall biosynthesis
MAWRRFGVQRTKVEVMHLGVEIDRFHLPNDQERTNAVALRRKLGFDADEIVFIYTGKLTEDKNPLLLAESIAQLRSQGARVASLFVGDGGQRDALARVPGAKVIGFVPNRELPPYYWAADAAVWPTNESISMLDAAACGLPIIISSLVAYREHVDGNGLVFEAGDGKDLLRVIRLLFDPSLRKSLGEFGAHKMCTKFTWEAIARRRLNDYQVSLKTIHSSYKI